jgi:flagellar hook-associated protein 2
MGTITMTGYNNIDWNSVLTAVMQQESQPLQTMQTQYSTLSARSTAFATLASKLSALQSSATTLETSDDISGRTGTSTDSATAEINASSTAMVGTYEVVVNSLAHAQVTTSDSTVSDKTTVVATGGKLTINGTDVVLAGETTLEQLAADINGTTGTGVAATIVSATVGGIKQYQMVLTATDSGVAHAFTVNNALEGTIGNVTGGPAFAFSTTNAVAASDADITLNGVHVTNDTNTFSDVIPGATVTVHTKNAGTTVLTVGRDPGATKTAVQGFITSYNDLVSFYNAQAESAKNGSTGTLASDAMLRSLRSQLTSQLLASVTASGAYTNLAEVGFEFQRDGTLSLNESTFDDAMATNQADVEGLLAGPSGGGGAFGAVTDAIKSYTSAGGLLPDAQSRLNDQMTQLNDRMSSEQDRLAIRKLSLQQEYSAADSAIATLNSQANSLSGLSSGYKLY